MTKKDTERKRKILLVDDDEGVICAVGRLMKRLMKDEFPEVEIHAHCTKTVEEVIKFMHEIEPEIMLFDHNYHDKYRDGFELVKVARNGLSCKIKKIISITSNLEAGEMYMEKYGVEWIKKIEFPQIIERTKEYLKNN